MIKKTIHLVLMTATLSIVSIAVAGDDPIHERHELMEDVRDAAKPMGKMLRGEAEYDAEVVQASLAVFADVSKTFGGLFPEGTETGGGTEAAPAIWEDRAGFEEALAEWSNATNAAISAKPATLEEAKPVLGKVFGTCKNCHDTYRIEEE